MRTRSYLYVPANDQEKLTKAPSIGADALIVDLEDSVGAGEKTLARGILREWLKGADIGINLWIRINSDSIDEDLDVIVDARVSGVILPKSSSNLEMELVSQKLLDLERQRGLKKSLEIYALIESAKGVLNALSIAQNHRVTKLILGELDLRADLSLPLSAGDQVLLFARSSIVFASAAAGIDPPIASVSSNFRDLEEFERGTIAYRDLGYFGRTCINPNQIEIVNRVFTNSLSEIKSARDLLKKIEAAGGGVAVDAEGRMIDEASAKNARRIIHMHD